MFAYSLFVFDRRFCLFRQVWGPESALPIGDTSRQEKLLHGLVFSLRRFYEKLSNAYKTPEENRIIGESGFASLTTSQYRLHVYESLSGYKFVCFTDNKRGPLKLQLKEIYEKLFVNLVIFNPAFYTRTPLNDLEEQKSRKMIFLFFNFSK